MLDVQLLLLLLRSPVRVREWEYASAVVKTGSLAPVQPETERERERPDCNILSVNPSQSPLLPESLSSSVISLCWHLEFQYSERHPSLTSGQDRAELDGRFHNFSLSLCPSGVIWSSRRSSVGNIKIRFTEIRVWKSTTFDKNYTLILTVHFMRRFKVILESNTIIW